MMDGINETYSNDENNALASVAKDLIPKEFAKRYKALKKAQEELNEMENLVKTKLLTAFESIPDREINKIDVDGISFTYVAPSKRKSVDTKKLQEEEPEIYKKFLKESNVKSSIRINVEY